MSISAVTSDTAGRVISWIEGEYTFTVSRDSAGRPMYLSGTSPGRKTISVQFEYKGTGGAFSGMIGSSASIMLADLVRDAEASGSVPIFGVLDGSGQIISLVGPGGKPTPSGGGGGVTVVNDLTSGGTLYALSAEMGKSLNTTKAPLASPTFTGTPAAPTAAADTNTTQLATTAFVAGQAGATTPAMDGVAAVGTSLKFARQDHVHPTDTSRAPLASPTFTGTPAAPTAAVDTSTTQLATTAFVTGQAASTTPAMDGTAAVGTSTRFARQDHVHPTDTSRAPLAMNVQAAKTSAYTLVAGDMRSVIPVNSASSTTITLNTGLGAGFSAVLVQKGAGVVTVSGTATLRGTTSTTNQYDVLTITPIGTDEYLCKVG